MIDLRPHFKHLHWRPMQHAFGAKVASDWADKSVDDPVFGLYKNCGLWTMDEVQILHQCALDFSGHWLDIGCHTGWTTRHILEAGRTVDAIDPMLAVAEFQYRAMENCPDGDVRWYALTSDQFFEPGQVCRHSDRCDFDEACIPRLGGACVDGAHCAPHPERDGLNAAKYLADRGVILFHDAIGKPVQDGVMALHRAGFQVKVYPTPHVVAVCWRGDWVPPNYTGDAFVRACVASYLGEIGQFV